VAAVLLRALLNQGRWRPLSPQGLRAFHLTVWSAIPVGALLGGLVGRERGVAEVLVWAGASAIAAILPLFAVGPRNRLTQVEGP